MFQDLCIPVTLFIIFFSIFLLHFLIHPSRLSVVSSINKLFFNEIRKPESHFMGDQIELCIKDLHFVAELTLLSSSDHLCHCYYVYIFSVENLVNFTFEPIFTDQIVCNRVFFPNLLNFWPSFCILEEIWKMILKRRWIDLSFKHFPYNFGLKFNYLSKSVLKGFLF